MLAHFDRSQARFLVSIVLQTRDVQVLLDKEIEKSLDLFDTDLHTALTVLKVQPRIMAVVAKAGITDASTFSMIASSGPGMKDWAIKELGLDDGISGAVMAAKLGVAWHSLSPRRTEAQDSPAKAFIKWKMQ